MKIQGKGWGLLAALLGICTGCRTPNPWGDLSAPVEWHEVEGEPVFVSDGTNAIPIVVDEKPRNRAAAQFLAEVIGETTGVKPIVLVDKEIVTNGLCVGEVRGNQGWACPLATESAEAFRVVAESGQVHFLGRADYAVYDWCERVLGVRFYPLYGMSVVREPRLEVSPVDYSDRPVFEYRHLGNESDNEPWLRVSRAGDVHRGRINVHAPHAWVKDAALKRSKPDIFENGETPMLCYGNPKTLAYYKERIDRHIAGVQDSGGIVNTNRKVVTVSAWDAPVACTCGVCRVAYDVRLGARGTASPILWSRFLRPLAAWLKTAHPDYEIEFLPYQNTCEVPFELKGFPGRRRWRLLRNAEADVCTMPGLALLKDAAIKANEERILREWQHVTDRKVLSWDYSCWPEEWTAAPYIFGETIKSHYCDLRDDLCGAFICGNAESLRMALSHYVWMRCLWNPELDVEAVYDEFAARTFGPAALPMRALIGLQEACWNRPWEGEDCTYHNIFEISYPREDVLRMKALVRAAEQAALAANDAVSLMFVRGYAKTFEEFVAESDALAARKGPRQIPMGTRCEMVDARSALHPYPWAGTSVVVTREGDDLCFRVVCSEPAVAKMDFSRKVKDAVWGNDTVTFVFEQEDETRTIHVDLTGNVTPQTEGFVATVSHTDKDWTVDARKHLTEDEKARGCVRGNIARWRVGDRRLPVAERVPGSRYQKSRLNTVYTNINADPAAFVNFVW